MVPCRSVPPLTARGSPIRSKSVLVSHPWPVNPFPPCSAGTDGSAPASAFGKTGYEFLSRETLLGVADGGGGCVGRGRWGRPTSTCGGYQQRTNQPGQAAKRSYSHVTLHCSRSGAGRTCGHTYLILQGLDDAGHWGDGGGAVLSSRFSVLGSGPQVSN